MNDKKATLVAAKLQGRTLEGWIYYNEGDGEYYLSTDKPKPQEVARCPKCKHNHGTSFNASNVMWELDSSNMKRLGIVKSLKLARVVIAVTPESLD